MAETANTAAAAVFDRTAPEFRITIPSPAVLSVGQTVCVARSYGGKGGGRGRWLLHGMMVACFLTLLLLLCPIMASEEGRRIPCLPLRLWRRQCRPFRETAARKEMLRTFLFRTTCEDFSESILTPEIGHHELEQTVDHDRFVDFPKHIPGWGRVRERDPETGSPGVQRCHEKDTNDTGTHLPITARKRKMMEGGK